MVGAVKENSVSIKFRFQILYNLWDHYDSLKKSNSLYVFQGSGHRKQRPRIPLLFVVFKRIQTKRKQG